MRPKNKIPKPFSRPAIDLSSTPRVWLTVTAGSVDVGDTVVDIGVVQKIDNIAHENFDGSVVLQGPEKSQTLDANDGVLAFVKRRPTDNGA